MLGEIEQIQLNALKTWWAKRKEKAKKLGWKYGRKSYIREDGALMITMLDGSNNKHFLKVSTDGEVCFEPATMTCF